MKNDLLEPAENEGKEDLNNRATLDKLEQILSQLIDDVEFFRIQLKELARSIKE